MSPVGQVVIWATDLGERTNKQCIVNALDAALFVGATGVQLDIREVLGIKN